MFRTLAVVMVALLVSISLLACGGGNDSDNGSDSDESSGPRVRVVLTAEGCCSSAEAEGLVAVVEARVGALDGTVEAWSETAEGGFEFEIVDMTKADVERLLGPVGLFQLCEPVTDESGNVAVTQGDVQYEPGTCNPERDADGSVITTSGEVVFGPLPINESFDPETIVWQPMTEVVDGEEIEASSRHTTPDSFISLQGGPDVPVLVFQFDDAATEVLTEATSRLANQNYPVAMFLDGQPLFDVNSQMLAPRVQAPITGGQVTITGLDMETAEHVGTLLNSGAYPARFQITSVEELD